MLVPYHVAIRTDVVLVDPEDRAAPLRAHTGVCQPAGPGIFLIFGFDLIFYSLGDVSKGIAHFVTSGARVRGEEPSTESHET